MPAPPKQRKIAIVGSRSVGKPIGPSPLSTFPYPRINELITVQGKSSLTVQFVDGHFVESYYPTIENTFSKVIKFKGQEYATEIIDTAGQVCASSSPSPLPSCSWLLTIPQDEYSILNSKHFIGIHGYMLVYSVASMQSFEMIRVIRDKILNHLVFITLISSSSEAQMES